MSKDFWSPSIFGRRTLKTQTFSECPCAIQKHPAKHEQFIRFIDNILRQSTSSLRLFRVSYIPFFGQPFFSQVESINNITTWDLRNSISWGSNSSARAFTCSAMTSKTSSSWLSQLVVSQPTTLSYKLQGDWHRLMGELLATKKYWRNTKSLQVVSKCKKPSKSELDQHL